MFKLITSFIIIMALYKYIKDNLILVVLISLYLYGFLLGNVNPIMPIIILVSLNYLLKYLMKFKVCYNLFNIDQTEVVKEGQIIYKNLKYTGTTLEELIELLKYENIDEIEDCYINSKKELTVYKNKIKNPLNIIVEGNIIYKNLKLIDKDVVWLNNLIKRKHLTLENICYAFYINDNLFFIRGN
ncbi:MAG: DUF421 domain-containing protein [Bacilli bacterium]